MEEVRKLSDIEFFEILIAKEKKWGTKILPYITAKEYLEKNVRKIKWAETVLEYGREFSLPTEEKARQMYEYWRTHKFPYESRQCYSNSLVFGETAGWPYVEGLAMTIPTRALFHAWNAVPGSLVALDVTWPLFSYFVSYMGIELPVDFVLSLIKEREGKEPKLKCGILYSWDIFKEPVKEFLRTRRTNGST